MELDNRKSEGSRLAPTSAGSLAGNGVLQPLLERLKRLEGLACRSLDNKEIFLKKQKQEIIDFLLLLLI